MVVQRNWKGKQGGRLGGKGRDYHNHGNGDLPMSSGLRFTALNKVAQSDSMEEEMVPNQEGSKANSSGIHQGAKNFYKTKKTENILIKNGPHKQTVQNVPSPMEAYQEVKSRLFTNEPKEIEEQTIISEPPRRKQVKQAQQLQKRKKVVKEDLTVGLRPKANDPLDLGNK